jgi:ABC-type bacteriocin/lantibiotic exporter with double-glycine peptidase domain
MTNPRLLISAALKLYSFSLEMYLSNLIVQKWCIILQDDPLSALDYQVGQKVFDSGIRQMLQREKRTVILVTHRLQLLAHAHQVH